MPTNVGAALARAMRNIERSNPDTLARVFGAADWGNREMLGDELLKDLLEEALAEARTAEGRLRRVLEEDGWLE